MKPLTIERLKSLEVGDWVWIIVLKEDWVNKAHNGKYYQIQQSLDELIDKELWCGWQGYGTAFEYSNYGTKWLAYKNKEQANGELEIVRNETEKKLATWLLKQIKKNATDVHFTNYDECGEAVSLTVAESLMSEIKHEAERRLAELKGE